MSLAGRYRGSAEADRRGADFACPHYESVPGEKRCRNYLTGGACSRSDEFMCVEWLKANGQAIPQAKCPAAKEQAAETSVQEPGPATDLFGKPLPAPPAVAPPKKQKSAPTLPCTSTGPEREERPPLRGLTTEDVESFKALGVEVCVSSEALGQVWLVPEYTGKDRKEITAEHAATICRVLEAFPGSTVVAFHKNPKTDEETDA